MAVFRSRAGLTLRIAVAATLAAVSVAGCSSSGGSVSLSKLETKIKSEPEIQTLLSQGGTKAAVTDALVHCIASALDKDADQADLKKYVSGKLNLDDVGAKAKGATNDAQTVAKNCASSAVPSAAASASASASATT
jgi:hypothetical protein